MDIIIALIVLASFICICVFAVIALIKLFLKQPAKKNFKRVGLSALIFLSSLIGLGVVSNENTSSDTRSANVAVIADASDPGLATADIPDQTATPTPDPTAAPTPDPTAAPTPDPTAAPTPDPATTITYILNTSSGKIHLPNCKSVRTIKPENYGTTDKTIDELLSEGYTRCGNCLK